MATLIIHPPVKKPLMLEWGKRLLHNKTPMSELHKPRVAILASGEGTTAEAYAQVIHDDLVRHEIGLVITNKPDAGVLDRTQRWNREWGFEVETAVINSITHPFGHNDRGQTYEEAEAIASLASKRGIDLIATLGYMMVINEPLITKYGYLPDKHRSVFEARMINSHPGPLPLTADTYHKGPAAQTLEAFERGEIDRSQHTVHVVAQGVDSGPVVGAHDVPILADDTPDSLFERTRQVEKAIIGNAIDSFLLRRAAYLEGNRSG